ncbi:MAG: polyprenyl synthetase family protein, partial [Cyanobacteria bacterium J06635_15]
MNELSLDLVEILVNIRNQILTITEEEWPELGNLIDSVLPNPLNPMALLPIATGRAVGGNVRDLIPIASAVILFDLSLRIVDDCADQDDSGAIYHAIGIGRAVNYAMALNTIATRELWRVALPADRLSKLLTAYFHSFLQVCRGQDDDLSKRVTTLDSYQEVVRLKTIAAYEFAAAIGAHVGTADSDAISTCSVCGVHLGWMAQILNDIEALWFPKLENHPEIKKMTFPVLLGLSIDHPNAKEIENLYRIQAFDRAHMCALLDEMDVRTRLMNLALDHRDRAIKSLA